MNSPMPFRGRTVIALLATILMSTACWHDVLPPTETIAPAGAPSTQAVRIHVVGDGYWSGVGRLIGPEFGMRALDRGNGFTPNRPVRFSVLSGGGDLRDSVGITDRFGEVTIPGWRFGNATAKQELRVSVDSAEVVLTGYAYRETRPPEGGRLIVQRGGTVLHADIGDGTTWLLAEFGTRFHIESVSPIDQMLALTDARTGALCVARIGSDVPRCLESSGLTYFGSFAWSPSGQQLLFTAAKAEICAVSKCSLSMFQLDLASQAIVRLLPNVDGFSYVRWSPDGQSIAFMRARTLWMMNADGTSPRVLLAQDSLRITDVRWSPTGEQLALTVNFEFRCDWACDTGLAVLNRDGSGLRLLLQANQANNQQISSAVRSSDGTRIAFGMGLVWADDPRQTDTYGVSIADGTVVRLFNQGTPLLWR